MAAHLKPRFVRRPGHAMDAETICELSITILSKPNAASTQSVDSGIRPMSFLSLRCIRNQDEATVLNIDSTVATNETVIVDHGRP